MGRMANTLLLREMIRKTEEKLGFPEIDLPSEDSIMDHPDRYKKYLERVLKLLQRFEDKRNKAIDQCQNAWKEFFPPKKHFRR